MSEALGVYRHRWSLALALALASLLLVQRGCLPDVPWDYPKKPSVVLPATDETVLGRDAIAWSSEHDGASGFLSLRDGIDALGVRLRLIELAEESIDVQYFILKPDAAGTLFLGKLLRAADRGVRVRFLIDDIFTPNMDSELALLTSHPGIEIRIFNPLARSRLRYWSFFTDFRRANRRMHNKSFTIDGAYTIVGGRNIADEYFETHEDVSFLDFDLLGLGPVAREVGESFDLFWNSALAVPIDAFDVHFEESEIETWRQRLREKIDLGEGTVYPRAIASPLLRQLIDGEVELMAAKSEVVTDRPEKLKVAPGLPDYREVVNELMQRLSETKHELLLVTPYFVPRQAGTDVLALLARRGVRVAVITNSLASTNQPVVHSGYARYRKQLLEAGVELYEARVDAMTKRSEDARLLTLHAKAAIFDREVIFVGSLNLDPRSLDINTEMGILLESTELVGGYARGLAEVLPGYAYRVVLDEAGSLEWIWRAGVEPQRFSTEPDASLWRRLLSWFYGLLPIEGQI